MKFLLADESHDGAIRALLRTTPIKGAISIRLEREPSYFGAARAEGGEHHAVVAIKDGEVVCVGGITVRDRYYNGRLRRVGYLGQLRLAPSHAGRFDVVRRGYRFMADLVPGLGVDLCFTSIPTENHRARRFLERGLPGLPMYQFVGDLVTLIVPMRRLIGPSPFLRDSRASHGRTGVPPVPAWAGRPCDVVPIMFESDPMSAAVGQYAPANLPCGESTVWDQRAFKQVVVAGYSPPLRWVRPAINWLLPISLPPAGSVLPMAYLVRLGEVPAEFPAGVEMVAFGLDARDPLLPSIMKLLKPRRYFSRLYNVFWPGHPAEEPDGRLLFPEVSTL